MTTATQSKKTISLPADNPSTERPHSVKSRIELYTCEPMVNWLGPGELLKTGIRAAIAVTIGGFADPRKVQAALNPPDRNPPLRVDEQDSVWIDYLADTGDGWDSTYSVAWSVSRDALIVPGVDRPLPRGDVLVCGGDQVYPTPANNGYRTRFLDPYRGAFPGEIGPPSQQADPLLLAIPGNHDWYDGLRGFTEVFCSQKPVGRWRTAQRTSYFAVKLPHGWWLWGLDLQLNSEIDRQQREYFTWIAETRLREGDRILLCTPEPSWIEESERLHRDGSASEDEKHGGITEAARSRLRQIEIQDPQFQSLRQIEELIADSKKATLAAVFAGDHHYYAHFLPDSERAPHRITCGGGGGYLLGTDDVPDDLRFKIGGEEQCYTRGAVFPDQATSRRLRDRAWQLPFRNPAFGGLLAAIYLLYVWVLQSASNMPNSALDGLSLMEYLARVPLSIGNALGAAPAAVLKVMVRSPASVLFTLGILAGSGAFTASGVRRNTLAAIAGGIVHGVMHLALAVSLLWSMANLNLGALRMPVDSTWQVLLFLIEIALLGGLFGGLLFGAWMVLANRFFRWHQQEVFSSQRIADFKSFLRIHIDAGGLTLYPLKIRKVCRRWKLGAGIQVRLRGGRTWQLRAFRGCGARFEPVDPINVELIEPPLHIPAPHKH